MNSYLVKWEISIDADSYEEAAREALLIHRDPNSEATVFIVRKEDSAEQRKTIDLKKTVEPEEMADE